MKKSLLVIILVGSLCLLDGCGGSSSSSLSPPPVLATHFSVTAPATATAGTAFNFTVTALDASNNTVTGYSGTVHFTSTDSQAVLPASSTLTNGTGTFSVTFKTGGPQTITATDTVKASVTGTSNPTNVSAGPATTLSVAAPATAAVGTTFNFTVTAFDALNNVATSYAGTVHFTSSDGQATLPANSVLTNGTATFPATLKTTGSQTITATDMVKTAIMGTSSLINVTPLTTLAITSLAPPSGTVGSEYHVHFESCQQGSPGCNCHSGPYPYCVRGVSGYELAATGGLPGYTWSWAAAPGSSLPPGLNIFNASGTSPSSISGLPTMAGSYNVIVTVTDSESPAGQATAKYSIVIDLPPPPAINTTPHPYSPVVRLPYAYTFMATSTLPPLTWSETGALPVGLTLSPGGVLSGTPSAVGSFPITVTAQDSAGQDSAPVNFTIQVFLHGFAPTGNMTEVRESHTATLLNNGKVLITGGGDERGNSLATAELFDETSGTFAPTSNMAVGRYRHTATLLNDGKVLVTGGGTASAELFDPASGSFAPAGSMESARYGHTATLLNDGKVLVTGGVDTNGSALATAELFDPSNSTFTPAGSMDTARSMHTAVLLGTAKVLLIGGRDASGNPLATAELFDPTSGSFTPMGSMGTARESHTATVLNDGRVLVAGGLDATGSAVATAELFDPNSGSFAATGNMTTARALHTATLLKDGNVLIAGPDQTAELFDPNSGTFAATGSMTTARASHTATLLGNGTVLITGGHDVNINSTVVALTSAELYQ